MFDNQSKEVKSIATRLAKITKPQMALERMAQILKSKGINGYPRIGHYVPDIGFMIPSTVPGSEYITVPLVPKVHEHIKGLMENHKGFIVLRHRPFSLLAGVAYRSSDAVIDEHGVVHTDKLTFNCERVMTLSLNLGPRSSNGDL